MAIYRNIRLSFWTDPKIVDEFDLEEKYFFLYLLTNPHTNLCGCYQISFRQIADESSLPADQILTLIQRMEDLGTISYCPETKEILILHWYRYNWTTSSKFRKALIRDISQVRNLEFKQYLVALAPEEREDLSSLSSLSRMICI